MCGIPKCRANEPSSSLGHSQRTQAPELSPPLKANKAREPQGDPGPAGQDSSKWPLQRIISVIKGFQIPGPSVLAVGSAPGSWARW